MTTRLNMKMKSIQAPGAVVMIRPHHFHPNPETADDNAFQRTATDASPHAIAGRARDEVTVAAAALEAAGVTVHIFDDFGGQETPDSVFPNNWFSTHAGGHVAIYPMYSPNRRRERRWGFIAQRLACRRRFSLMRRRSPKFRPRWTIPIRSLDSNGSAAKSRGAPSERPGVR